MKQGVKYRVFTIFCLGIICCYVLRPVMPYMEYMINKDFISKNLCVQKDIPDNTCHGKCYLHKQIEKTQHENKSDQDKNREDVQNTRLDDHIASGEIPPPPVEVIIYGLQVSEFPLVSSVACPIFVPPKG
jgi:hypothetical protein